MIFRVGRMTAARTPICERGWKSLPRRGGATAAVMGTNICRDSRRTDRATRFIDRARLASTDRKVRTTHPNVFRGGYSMLLQRLQVMLSGAEIQNGWRLESAGERFPERNADGTPAVTPPGVSTESVRPARPKSVDLSARRKELSEKSFPNRAFAATLQRMVPLLLALER